MYQHTISSFNLQGNKKQHTKSNIISKANTFQLM